MFEISSKDGFEIVYELKNGLKSFNQKPSCLCSEHKQTRLFIQNLNTQNFYSSTKKFSVVNHFFKLTIQFYQATFAHFLGGRCRYYPSCSHYALEAFENFSFFQAIQIVSKRVISCHPLSRKDFYDPVPMAITESRMT